MQAAEEAAAAEAPSEDVGLPAGLADLEAQAQLGGDDEQGEDAEAGGFESMLGEEEADADEEKKKEQEEGQFEELFDGGLLNDE